MYRFFAFVFAPQNAKVTTFRIVLIDGTMALENSGVPIQRFI